MKWLYNCKCELCGYQSPFYNWQWMAKLIAIGHSASSHPSGHCSVEAVDTETFKKNRQIDSV